METSQYFRAVIQQGGNRASSDARGIRDELCDCFNSRGQVPWHWDMAYISNAYTHQFKSK